MDKEELSRYLEIIRKWWWIIALLFAATVCTMLVISFLSEPQYSATVTVQVSAPPPQEVPLYSTLGKQALSDEIIRTQTSLQELLVEGDVVYRVLDELPEVPMRGNELRQRLNIEIPTDSHLMRISVTTANPEMSALLANAVVESGLTQYAELAAKPTASMRVFIEQQLNLALTAYEGAEAELTEFQVANKIGSLDTAIDRQYDLIKTLKSNRDVAQSSGDLEKARELDQIIVVREAELQNLIGLSSDYYTLVGRVDRARDTYNFMLDKKAEAQIKENQILELSTVQVITPARPPLNPKAALDSRLIALGAVVSLIVGVLLAFLLEYLDMSGAFQRRQQSSSAASLPESQATGEVASLG